MTINNKLAFNGVCMLSVYKIKYENNYREIFQETKQLVP